MSPVQSKGPATTLPELSSCHTKNGTSGFFLSWATPSYPFLKNTFLIIMFVDCYIFSYLTGWFSALVTDGQLFSIMETICALVDSIPEHELIGLSCGNELLLKRAQRSVKLRRNQISYHFIVLNVIMV